MKKNYLLFLLLFSFVNIFPQSINISEFEYLSPVPYSKLNSSGTNIIIRFGEAFDINNGIPVINVFSASGNKINGNVKIAEQNETLLFRPYEKFGDGETITVKVDSGYKTISGEDIPPLTFSFDISQVDLNKANNNPLKYSDIRLDMGGDNLLYNEIEQSQAAKLPFLPADFPGIVSDSINNPTPGYLFFSPFTRNDFDSVYMMITDNYGVPVYYKKNGGSALDFKIQASGDLTYYVATAGGYCVMDSLYNVVDTLYMQNGYTTDLHELKVLPNGHALLMSYDEQKIAMDTIVEGGNPNATVAGLIIQEIDEEENVLFQWRSWDHVKITDATHDINLKAANIDYIHGNAIEPDMDGNILISSRNIDEITKINRRTGKIMWRWGGKSSKNNEFSFLNDNRGFSHQHDIRRLPNGNLSLFDNGNLNNPQYTRVAEYKVDEVNKTASLEWEYNNDPPTFSLAMGSHRTLKNGNKVIGWGWTTTPPFISEITRDGKVKMMLEIPNTLLNYRVFKFPWKTTLFTSNVDTVDFGYISFGDSAASKISVRNNSDNNIKLTGFYCREDAFRVDNVFPINLPPHWSVELNIIYKPTKHRKYVNTLQIRSDSKNEGIAQVISVKGFTDTLSTDVAENNSGQFSFNLKQNYPNPFNPSTRISFSIPSTGEVTLTIFDVLGREIKEIIREEMQQGSHSVEFNGAGLSSGFYFYELKSNNFRAVRKMLLMK